MVPRAVTDDDTGLKVQFEPPGGSGSAEVDIVAIHGIGVHPDDTWCWKVGTGSEKQYVNWLKDEKMLPSAVPKARILRFGYMSKWFGDDSILQRVSRVASRLLDALKFERLEPSFRPRPLIFVAHCFGGLVVLKALLQAQRFPEDWPGIYSSVAGIIFLGTPFRGSPQLTQTELIRAAEAKHLDTVQDDVLRILQPDDEMLLDVVSDFTKVQAHSPNKIHVVCFFEERTCDVYAILGMEGKRSFVVSESSGCLDGVHKVGLQRSHFDMNKFSKETDGEYRTVCGYIKEAVQKALRDTELEGSSLYFAARNGNEPAVRKLVDRGVSTGERTSGGWTPLHAAAWFNHGTVVKILVEAGAGIEATAHCGWTPLHGAVRNGHERVARLLLGYHSNTEARTNDGYTPLHLAAKCGYENLARLFLDNADKDAKDGDGRTPLYISAKGGYEEITRLLLNKGADMTVRTKGGWTALHAAARFGHESTSKVLIDMGSDMESRSKGGETPLFTAAKVGHMEVVRLLVEKGANRKAKDGSGLTPQKAAKKNGYTEVAKWLKEYHN